LSTFLPEIPLRPRKKRKAEKGEARHAPSSAGACCVVEHIANVARRMTLRFSARRIPRRAGRVLSR
jgi:hypothetical protein